MKSHQNGQVLTEFIFSVVIVLMLFLWSHQMVANSRSAMKASRHKHSQKVMP